MWFHYINGNIKQWMLNHLVGFQKAETGTIQNFEQILKVQLKFKHDRAKRK